MLYIECLVKAQFKSMQKTLRSIMRKIANDKYASNANDKYASKRM